jgi:hypothetical protein
MEIWKDILGYENLYQISSMGRVKSLSKSTDKSVRIMKYSMNKRGYCVQTLTKNNVKKQYQIHRLVALNFIKNHDNKPIVHHKNGKPFDNRMSNLEWVTAQENIKHGFDYGKIILPYQGKKIKCSNGMIFSSSYQAAEWLDKIKFKGSKKIKSTAALIRRSMTYNWYAYGYKWTDII